MIPLNTYKPRYCLNVKIILIILRIMIKLYSNPTHTYWFCAEIFNESILLSTAYTYKIIVQYTTMHLTTNANFFLDLNLYYKNILKKNIFIKTVIHLSIKNYIL